MVIVFVFTAVFFVLHQWGVVGFNGGYVGSLLCPPCICRYCPHTVDNLISQWYWEWWWRDGSSAAVAVVEGATRFLAVCKAHVTVWLVKLCIVHSGDCLGHRKGKFTWASSWKCWQCQEYSDGGVAAQVTTGVLMTSPLVMVSGGWTSSSSSGL